MSHKTWACCQLFKLVIKLHSHLQPLHVGGQQSLQIPHHSVLYFCHPVGWYCMRTLICILLRRALQSTFPELTACTSSSQHGYSHLCPASKSSLYSLDIRIVMIKYVHTYIYIYVCVLQLKTFTKSPFVEM